MGYCGFYEDSCAPMCRFVWVICGVKCISRDDEVGFGGEVCLTNKENVDTVFMHEALDFVFVLVWPICIPLGNT